MTNSDLTERAAALCERSLFAEIGYTDPEGRPNIRKTFCVWHKGLGGHLISTNTSSRHVRDIWVNGNACMYFSDDSTFEGLCLWGKAYIRREREYRELLWNEGDEKYYPGGIDDEDYCVIEFIADSGRYYRYDGKGDITVDELTKFDTGKVYENGYARTHSEKQD